MSKIALITGGSRGLGKDMAIETAKSGIDVVLTYKDSRDLAEDVADQIRSLGRKADVLQLDVSRAGTIGQFMDDLKKVLQSGWGRTSIDYLVNNAGTGATIPMKDVTEDQFDQLLNIHYRSVYFLTQACLSVMEDNGAVVFISSGTTRFCVPGYSVYAPMKGAIEVLSRYVAKEFGPRGIRSNVVAPGPIETDFNNGAIRNNPQMKTGLSAASPLGRVGVAEDIGGVVAFLLSPGARWVNGQRIEVSGGINI